MLFVIILRCYGVVFLTVALDRSNRAPILVKFLIYFVYRVVAVWVKEISLELAVREQLLRKGVRGIEGAAGASYVSLEGFKNLAAGYFVIEAAVSGEKFIRKHHKLLADLLTKPSLLYLVAGCLNAAKSKIYLDALDGQVPEQLLLLPVPFIEEEDAEVVNRFMGIVIEVGEGYQPLSVNE